MNERNHEPPARQRRAIEREYVAALADAVPLEAWREICHSTVAAAKNGDHKAREWLARYLLGAKPVNLLDLAADEVRGTDIDALVEARGRDRTAMDSLGDAFRDLSAGESGKSNRRQ